MTEIEVETTHASTAVANNTDAFNNFLKLPSSGYLLHLSKWSPAFNQGNYGYIRSSSPSSGSTINYSQEFYFKDDIATTVQGSHGTGLSVRCIKD